jgi:RNA-directed DNA polymerase
MLEPIFEADLDPTAYGYRPKRRAEAIKAVHAWSFPFFTT